MVLVRKGIYLYRHQKQWLKTLSERTKISQSKLLRILTCRYVLITNRIEKEELQEILLKSTGIPREKLDELNRVKGLLRKKRKDQIQRFQYFFENWDKPIGKSHSELVRYLIECDMLDAERFAKWTKRKLQLLEEELRLKKEESQLLNLKIKYYVENKELRENKIHEMMVKNKMGA